MSIEVRDVGTGTNITLKRKTSIILTVVWVLAILSVIGVLVYGAVSFYTLSASALGEALTSGLGFILMLVLAIVNVRVLGFLRTKTDMSVERAVIQTTGGATVELWKDRSVWLTIGMAFSIIMLLIAIASAMLISSPIGSTVMLIVVVAMLLNILVLNFLRVKVMMKPKEASIQSIQGATAVLQKRTSVWLTFAMAIYVIAGIVLLISAALVGALGASPEIAGLTKSTLGGLLSGEVAALLKDYPMLFLAFLVIAAIATFIAVAIFSHLRTKVFLKLK